MRNLNHLVVSYQFILCAARGAFAIATLKLVCISQKCNYPWDARSSCIIKRTPGMKTIVNTTFEVNTTVARRDLILVMLAYDFGQDLNFQLHIRRYHKH